MRREFSKYFQKQRISRLRRPGTVVERTKEICSRVRELPIRLIDFSEDGERRRKKYSPIRATADQTIERLREATSRLLDSFADPIGASPRSAVHHREVS